jgi:hypothetical protein
MITITSEQGSERKIGRFAFLDTSGVIKYVPAVRMDVLYDIQDVYNKICENNKHSSTIVQNLTTKGKLIFSRNEFNIGKLNKTSI